MNLKGKTMGVIMYSPIIHNGVEWDEMETDFQSWPADKEALCERYGLPRTAFHFLFVGHGYKRKGLDLLLRALSQLPKEDVFLSVVGKDKRMEWYQSYADQLGIGDRVRFFGPQQDSRPFYQLADSLVIPSFYDPFANVTVEALAMGLFVVSSKNNGGHEILDEKNGAVIENLLDPEEVASALENSLAHRKTKESARFARLSVAHLDFSKQLNKLINACG